MRTLLLALALLAISPSIAEETPTLGRDGVNLSFSALGHRFVLPTPDWLAPAQRLSPDLLPLLESNTYGDATQAFVEFFPKGQSVDDWTTTYAARLTLQPGRSLDDYRRATMYGYSQICKEEALGFFNFGEETDTFFPALGMACGAYKDNGKLRGLGEVMVAVFRKTDTGIAMIYQEWKGRAFDPSDPTTWPVDTKAFQARAKELQDVVALEKVAD
ncbi:MULTISPECIES: hypothetical protein [unclassified Devosia]|uniref:hypothetical protein n=1 Tax=unclassified Devosia TaxID=196773 RepID=UPI00086D2DDB|nr:MULTISPECIES: hypothetical protein [unclassified Devosia]MBN9362358.1 hypothetical protein [Devosia sp.]ODS80621.1 MAG: hypothetical protein ABS47_25750 [Devosia sp. SCN 66-27]OJX24405.1 MAG: hypothetical protein BGO83_07190 [Devosia sp. 66-14]